MWRVGTRREVKGGPSPNAVPGTSALFRKSRHTGEVLDHRQGAWTTNSEIEISKEIIKILGFGDFPGSPVVKTPHPNTRGTDMIPGWETRMPDATGHSTPPPPAKKKTHQKPGHLTHELNSAHRSIEHLSK